MALKVNCFSYIAVIKVLSMSRLGCFHIWRNSVALSGSKGRYLLHINDALAL